MKKQTQTNKENTSKRQVSLRVLLISSLLSVLLGVGLSASIFFLRLDKDARSMLQVVNIIRSQYVGDYDWHEIADGSMDYMVSSLGDRWSYFLRADEYQHVLESRKNSYIGIGITVSRGTATGIEILNITPNSPAERAGMLVGDWIVAVDGVTVTEQNWRSRVEAIAGEEGSVVKLEVKSPSGSLNTMDITREKIVSIPVVDEMLPNHVGYVKIRNFYSGSGSAMIAAVDDLVQQGATSLVFDLRNNPGGYVTELTKMLDHLLPEGVIFQSRTLEGEEQVYTSDASMVDLPIAVLVNKDSYSAAEFFAAELRESAGAYISGELTSGKGFAQQLFPLRNGSAIGLSTSRYFTGKGVSLIGTGVKPDAQLSLSEEQQRLYAQEKLSHEEDGQLQAALSGINALKK